MCPLNLAMEIAPFIAEQNVNRWRTLWYFSVREVVQIYLIYPMVKPQDPQATGQHDIETWEWVKTYDLPMRMGELAQSYSNARD
jgi:hypothetical protein